MFGRDALLTLLFLVFCVGSAAAQVPFDRNRNQAIGGTAGLASGAGISYQEILPTAWGYRAALALWRTGDFSFFDLGLSGLKVLSDDGRQRFYLIGGVSYWRRSDEETEEIFDDQGNVVTIREFDDVDDSMALGFGAGIELPVGERVGFTLEGLFTWWTDSGDVIPLPQIGLHYLF